MGVVPPHTFDSSSFAQSQSPSDVRFAQETLGWDSWLALIPPPAWAVAVGRLYLAMYVPRDLYRLATLWLYHASTHSWEKPSDSLVRRLPAPHLSNLGNPAPRKDEKRKLPRSRHPGELLPWRRFVNHTNHSCRSKSLGEVSGRLGEGLSVPAYPDPPRVLDLSL